MKKIKHFLNTKIEALFQTALKDDKLSLFIISTTRIFLKAPYGIWLFRKGEISSSLALLTQIKKPSFLVTRCIKRCKDINHYLKLEFPEPLNAHREAKKFNNKVLFALHSNGYYHPNGYAVRTHNIIESLINENLHISCVTRLGYPWDLSETANEEQKNIITFNKTTFKQTFDPLDSISGPETDYIEAYTKVLSREAKNDNCTVIHAHSSYVNGIAAAKASKQLNIKSCYEVRGLWHLSRAIKEPLFNKSEHFYYCEKMELLACHLVDNIFVLTDTMKQWLVEKDIQEKKITIVPNGVTNNNAAIQHANIPSDKLTLGFLGSITEYEGLDIVINALSEIKQPNIELVIAGDGKYLPYLKKLVGKLTLTNKVTFLGRIPKEQIEQFYSTVDVIMVIRKDSTLTQLVSPIKHIEAFSYGKPCIVSRLPALIEAIKDKENSLVISPNSVTETVNAITLLYKDKKLLNYLTTNTKSIVKSKYNWNVIAKDYLQTYQRSSLN